jgi:hypothetical protein
MQHDYQYENLDFLRKQIMEIKFALFRPESNSVMLLPNNIIETIRVEDNGTIWFLTTCNGNYAKHLEKNFFTYLSYHKKGTGSQILINGMATIVENSYRDIFYLHNYARKGNQGPILVKMKIMQAECFDSKTIKNTSFTERIKSMFNNIFPAPVHRVYEFS